MLREFEQFSNAYRVQIGFEKGYHAALKTSPDRKPGSLVLCGDQRPNTISTQTDFDSAGCAKCVRRLRRLNAKNSLEARAQGGAQRHSLLADGQARKIRSDRPRLPLPARIPSVRPSTYANWRKKLSRKRSGRRRREQRPGRWGRSKEWATARQNALKPACEVCGIALKPKERHIHHIVPFREAKKHGDPDQCVNLSTLCPKCHGIATGIESRIFKADFVGAMQAYRQNLWPMELVYRAWGHYGFKIRPLLRMVMEKEGFNGTTKVHA